MIVCYGWMFLLIGAGVGFAAGTAAQWGNYEYGFKAGVLAERRPYRKPPRL